MAEQRRQHMLRRLCELSLLAGVHSHVMLALIIDVVERRSSNLGSEIDEARTISKRSRIEHPS